MSTISELDKEALTLLLRERKRLVLMLWESLESAPAVDPEGIEIALRRGAGIEYYDKERLGLGDAFRAEVYAVIDRTFENPELLICHHKRHPEYGTARRPTPPSAGAPWSPAAGCGCSGGN